MLHYPLLKFIQFHFHLDRIRRRRTQNLFEDLCTDITRHICHTRLRIPLWCCHPTSPFNPHFQASNMNIARCLSNWPVHPSPRGRSGSTRLPLEQKGLSRVAYVKGCPDAGQKPSPSVLSLDNAPAPSYMEAQTRSVIIIPIRKLPQFLESLRLEKHAVCATGCCTI